MGSWLPWLAGAAGLALVAAWSVARWLSRRRMRPTRPARPAPSGRPQPGEIWWADVPYEDGTGSKVRPCLVLRIRRGGADILKITSQDKRNRNDHVRFPTKRWDPRAEHDSYLDVATLVRVRSAAFVRPAGRCDPAIWRAIRRFHRVR